MHRHEPHAARWLVQISSRLSVMMLAVALCGNAFLLRHELVFVHDLNDNVAHWALVQKIDSEIQRGGNPFDAWSPESAGGCAVLRDYQTGAYFLVVGAYRAMGKLISLRTCFRVVSWLAIVLLPLGFWMGARLLCLSNLTCGLVALIAPLISTPGLYGLEYNSYIWGGNGSGMYPMSVATFPLIAAIGLSYRSAFERRMKWALYAGFSIAITLWCHWALGWMAAVTATCFAVLAAALYRKWRPLALLSIAGGISASLLAVRIYNVWQDWPVLNASRWEPKWKFDGFGWEKVAGGLLAGNFLDYGRPMVLTLLALAGIIFCIRQRHDWRYLVLLVGAALWLALLCGFQTFPVWLLALFGVAGGLPLHRSIAALQVFLILLSAVGFAWAVETVRFRWHATWAAVALVPLLLVISVTERARALVVPTQWGQDTVTALATEGHDLDQAIQAAAATGGRVYAGTLANWGQAFKLGQMQVLAELTSRGIPNVGYSFIPQSIPTDLALAFAGHDTDPLWYRVFNITGVISPAGTAGPWITPINKYGRFIAWRVTASPGYFEVITITQAVKTTKAYVYDLSDKWMQQREAEHGNYWLLDIGIKHEEIFIPPVMDGPSGVVLTQDGDAATVRMSRWGWLLYKVSYHPRWVAVVDGQPVPTVMVTPGFMAVSLTEGVHQVTMRYNQ